MILPARGFTPKIPDSCFLAPSADLIGDVILGERCSIWFNTTLRGDVMPIRIGAETNIQDGSTLHGTYNKCGATIGSRVTVGHNVVLHGCTIGDLCLIGMGAVIMDMANIPSRSFVGAGSLVTEGFHHKEEGWLILGRPAKAIRPLKPEEMAFLDKSAENYLHYMTWYEKAPSNKGVAP